MSIDVEAGPVGGSVQDLVARNFAQHDGELLIGGIGARELLERFGSPLYVYDLGIVKRQLQHLRATLPQRFSVFYSIKANPAQALLRHFVQEGCGLEIASDGELHQALAAGCPPERIVFAGPGKTEDELSAALDAGIGEIHVESLTEARRIARLAAARGQVAHIALRVNPSAAVEGGGMRMGAKPVAFGIDEDQLPDVLSALQSEASLRVVGLHLFVGTQILDADTLLRQYRAGLAIARAIAAQCGPLQTIDLGGGLGVPYFANERCLDLEILRTGLHALMAEIESDAAFHGTRFVLEPGRFLVAEAGIYLTRVTDIKVSRGKTFVIVDGGMHHHLAASGNLGQTIKRNFPVAVVNRLEAPATEVVEVAGPLCTPLDQLARALQVPEVSIGDVLGVFQSGAYGRSASPLGFLSRRAPAEVVVDAGQARLIRRSGALDDTLADQLP